MTATRRLAREVAELRFAAPVTHVYNPLEYAWAPHRAYIKAFADAPKRVIFLGMNPGPWGMAQTGVPFGEISHVREFLKISGRVGRPAREHQKRPVLGFACTRREVSGQRLWGSIQARFGDAASFFADHYIANYCPLAFLEESGRNRTPDKLPASERAPLFAACDRHLRRLVELLEPRFVIGVGAFAEARAREALAGVDVQHGRVLHPSPANPIANRDWSGTVAKQLTALGVWA
ncbi:MAG: single-stranded DNA-binding protein [Myxococcales bacterium]|nr:single-stranded DNA-binding protein [Myxococcales bacterium]